MSPPTVTIVILTWNQREHTLRCLESLERADLAGAKVLLVDNGSTDGTASVARDRFSHIDILRLDHNRGCAGGRNAGLERALADGSDYVCFLDNDTMVDPGFLRQMLATMEADPAIGICSGSILFHDEPELLWAAGGVINDDGTTPSLFHGRTIEDAASTPRSHASRPVSPLPEPGSSPPSDTPAQSSSPVAAPPRSRHSGADSNEEPADPRSPHNGTSLLEVDWVPGCLLLARTEVARTVGSFDERYFIYFEDIDWCASATAEGWRIVVDLDARIYHHVSRSLGGASSPGRAYYMNRNRLLFLEKHASRTVLVRRAAHQLASGLKSLALRRPNGVATLRGTFHYLTRRFGP